MRPFSGINKSFMCLYAYKDKITLKELKCNVERSWVFFISYSFFFSLFPQPLQFSCRPLYSTTMLNLSLCFTGFRDKDEMVSLRTCNLWRRIKNIIRSECFFVIRTEAYPNNRLVFSSCTHMTFVIFQICPYLVRLSVSIEAIYNFVHNKSRLLVYWWKKMEPNVWFCWLITKFNHYEV